MPRLWLANSEEALPNQDMLYSHFFSAKTQAMYARFLTSLHPGDLLAVPCPLDNGFVNYISAILGLGPAEKCYIATGLHSSSLIGRAISSSQELQKQLLSICSGPDWYLEPFIETPLSMEIAHLLNLPTRWSDPRLVRSGLIEKLNDKAFFKEMASGLGIPTIPGITAHNRRELEDALAQLERQQEYVMLRKTKYAGGAGNCSGPVPILRSLLDNWYNSGTVLCEPFLDIKFVAGSLVNITDSSTTLRAVDRQIMRNGGWVGYISPFRPATGPLATEFRHVNLEALENNALVLARSAQTMGARGLMNVDWIFLHGHDDTPVAMECNFRHNGLDYALEFAQSFFGPDSGDICIYNRENYATSFRNFRELRQAFSKLKFRGHKLLIESPEQAAEVRENGGVLITNPPNDGITAFTVFAPDHQTLEEARQLVKRYI